MSLSGDFEEAGKLWEGASWPMKGVIVLALFLTTSSITSLSEVIFGWKGFIMQALDFYRDWVTIPLRNLASSFGLDHFSQYEIDAIIVITIFISTHLRKGRLGRFSVIAMALILPVLVVSSGLSAKGPTWIEPTFIVFMLVSYVVSGTMNYIYDKAEFIRAYGPTVIAIIVVLLLGAINAGLSKPI